MAKGRRKRKERNYQPKKSRLSAGVAFSIVLALIMVGSVLTYFPTEKKSEPVNEPDAPKEDQIAKLLGIESETQSPEYLSDQEIAAILETKVFVRLFTSPFAEASQIAREQLESFKQEIPMEFEEVNALKHCSKTSSSSLKENCPTELPGYVIYAKERMPIVTGPLSEARLKELIIGNFKVSAYYYDGDCPICSNVLTDFRGEMAQAIQFESMDESEAQEAGSYPLLKPSPDDLVLPEYKMLFEEIFPQRNKDSLYVNGMLTTNPSAMFTDPCPADLLNIKYFHSPDANMLGVSVCANGTFPGEHENCNFTAGMNSVIDELEEELADKISLERYCLDPRCEGNLTQSVEFGTEYTIQILPALVFDCKYKRYGLLEDTKAELTALKNLTCELTDC